MSKTSPFIELAALRNHLHTPTFAHNGITRYIQTSAFVSLNFNKDHGIIVVVKVVILFYLYLRFYLFYILAFYMGHLSINIMHTIEALSPRGCRSVEVHIYIYIYIKFYALCIYIYTYI